MSTPVDEELGDRIRAALGQDLSTVGTQIPAFSATPRVTMASTQHRSRTRVGVAVGGAVLVAAAATGIVSLASETHGSTTRVTEPASRHTGSHTAILLPATGPHHPRHQAATSSPSTTTLAPAGSSGKVRKVDSQPGPTPAPAKPQATKDAFTLAGDLVSALPSGWRVQSSARAPNGLEVVLSDGVGDTVVGSLQSESSPVTATDLDPDFVEQSYAVVNGIDVASGYIPTSAYHSTTSTTVAAIGPSTTTDPVGSSHDPAVVVGYADDNVLFVYGFGPAGPGEPAPTAINDADLASAAEAYSG